MEKLRVEDKSFGYFHSKTCIPKFQSLPLLNFYFTAKLLVVGGRYNHNSNYVTKSEVIDLANPSKTCQPWADHPTGISLAAGAFVDSQVILCGGNLQSEVYSNDCHCITPTSTEAIVSLNVASASSAATEVNGQVLFSGGYGKNI